MADDDRTYLDYWFAQFFAPIGLPLIAGASVSTLIIGAVHLFLITSTSTSAAVCLTTTALLMAAWTLAVRFALVRILPGLTCGAVLCFVATMSIGICLSYELNHQGAMPALAHSTFIALVGFALLVAPVAGIGRDHPGTMSSRRSTIRGDMPPEMPRWSRLHER